MEEKINIKMKQNNTETIYYRYFRKSTDDPLRQAQSIERQKCDVEKMVKDRGLKVKEEIFSESKSAKEPGVRTEFYKMLEKIEAGEANAIACFSLCRLARNPVDGGKVQWLLQKGIIKSIQTIEKEYLPKDSGLLFSVMTGMANQEILNLGERVISGLRNKIRKGIYPNNAPLGYLNTKTEGKGQNYVIPDPERFELVRKMWDLMLTGNYSVPQIQKIANEKWAFKVKKTKKLPERPVSRSGLYRMFSSIFYTGMFFHKEELIENGQHKPMITLQEFDRVQEILGKKGKPRPKTRIFPFNGAIRCGECGSAICGEIKKEKYTFYHCICRDKKNKCSQKKWTKVEDLELQIKKEIDSFTILPEFRDWALGVARELHAKETETRSDIYETQHKTLTSCQAQLDKLVDMKLQDQLTDEEYNTKRNVLLKQINEMEKRLKETQNRAKDWLKGMETVFNFATNAHGHFIKGDYETKRKILLALGSNFLLKDGKLSIKANPLLIPIKKDCPKLEKKYLELELDKTLTVGEKEAALVSLSSEMRGQRDSNP